ncbi:DsbA family protein [Vibrio europaeus]|uniref:DsbA family protein n=1 Tax=Vibrio europaeus TaxID=300876 RepID=A0A178J8W1_9VIBR|nr:DsbA family protein [Vibrio europaeus]MDC5705157.1 DsbA family protein [Vibrio europaeus]MDC5710436.1 DsbA family protein [Vibrio europaeus]MDC5715526.1 DsbA family protein [Vibrio europaeus]MDC5719687.1 DsbA family protein [Vibrio europaeus]MDC5724425.1 DsbA family protein [Vibrio europaeus]
MADNKLYYVYDPMCSWCWGYKPVWQQICQILEGKIDIQYVVGGLAPDSDQPMPKEMQQQIASYWKRIEDFLGTQFNYDFWNKNIPRRSTYPACRAVLAARKQSAEKQMLTAIQTAYYLEARNPSDTDVLIDLADSIGLDLERFESDFGSVTLNEEFMRELDFARSIGGNSFPSLFVQTAEGLVELQVDYQSAQTTISQIEQLI